MIDWDEIESIIELRGVYDGWSVAVLKDGTHVNRWKDHETGKALEGYEYRYDVTEAYLRGEEPNGRWF